MSETEPVGLLDTNVFVHALTGDAHADECRRFLAALGEGRVRARLEPLIVHELSYAIGHYRRGVSRPQIAASIVGLVQLPGIVADKPLLVEALERWAATPGLGAV